MRYIGSKKSLVSKILYYSQPFTTKGCSFADLFAGTGAVGRAFKSYGCSVLSNDLLYFSYILQYASIQLNIYPKFDLVLANRPIAEGQYERHHTASLFDNLDKVKAGVAYQNVIAYLNNLTGVEGFCFREYCSEGKGSEEFSEKGGRQYFTPINAKKIDAIRQEIEQWKKRGLINEAEYALLLATLLHSISTIANTVGTFGAFKKKIEPRAKKLLRLEPLVIYDNGFDNFAFNDNANDLINRVNCDVLYLDPPYNQRQYHAYYHVLESIALGTEPKLAGYTGLPQEGRVNSLYCSRDSAQSALAELVKGAKCKHILLSYSSEGLLSADTIIKILSARGETRIEILDTAYRRFRSDRERALGAEEVRTRSYKGDIVEERLYHVTVHENS